MELKSTMNETLKARFDTKTEDGIGEMTDIMNHGADTGVHGFTYTWEINEFFDSFESEIEDYYYEIFGDNFLNELTHNITSFDELRARMVWGLVEGYCTDTVEYMEEKAIVA